MRKAFIVLENGDVFEGVGFGAEGEATGELVFTTGMGGYIETLTDPSYYGQIVMQTFPLIGNYGIIEADMESRKSFVKGYIVKEPCDAPSNFRCEETLEQFMVENNIVGVYGVDTRQMTRIIREHGVMNAKIVTEVTPGIPNQIRDYKIVDAVKSVCYQKTIEYLPEGEIKYTVVLINYGAKRNIVRELNGRGCKVIRVSFNTTAEEILAYKPDGIMLSNGPGDPEENTECIAQLKKLLGKVPIFGICLGHQMLALAVGGKTEKLKYGHRGVNQPVKDLSTGRVYITSQNHGYAVVAESMVGTDAVESFVNANDGTCEGMDYPDANAFTVQFHPEACGGPLDCSFLFDRFMKMIGGDK